MQSHGHLSLHICKMGPTAPTFPGCEFPRVSPCGSKKNPGFNSTAQALCTRPSYLSGAEVRVGTSQAHLQKEVPHIWKMPVSTHFFFNHIYKYGSSLTYMLGDGGQYHLTCLVKSQSQFN